MRLGGRGAQTSKPWSFSLGGTAVCTPRQGVTPLYRLSIFTRLLQMDTPRNEVRPPSPTPGSGTLWPIGGALAGCLLPVPIDSVPYTQPLTGHEPQYMPCGVLRVRPIARPPPPGRCHGGLLAFGPRCIPPFCCRLGKADTVTGKRGLTVQVRFLAGAPRWGSGACSLAGVFPAPKGDKVSRVTEVRMPSGLDPQCP